MRAFRVVVLAGLVACSSGEPAFEVPFLPTDPGLASDATLVIQLVVEGETDLLRVGTASYVVTVDKYPSVTMPQNLAMNLHVPGGYHDVTIRRAVPFSFLGPPQTPPWCDVVPPLTLAVSAVVGSSMDLKFHAACPTREGTAWARLNLKATGANVPDSAQALFLSQIEPRSLTAVIVPINMEFSVPLKPGIYRFGLNVPGCQFFGGPYSALPAPFLVRADGVKEINLTLPCG